MSKPSASSSNATYSRLRINAFAPDTPDVSRDFADSSVASHHQHHHSGSFRDRVANNQVYRLARQSALGNSRSGGKIIAALGALGFLLLLSSRFTGNGHGVSSFYTTSPTPIYTKALHSLEPILIQCEEADIHPIKCKVDHAQKLAAQLVERQSRTVEQALDEYVRRYNRLPPPGLEQWFELALHHNATIIDDYDQIMIDMQFFAQTGLVGEKLKARLLEAKTTLGDAGLGQLSIIDGEAVPFGDDRGPLSPTTLIEIFRPVQHLLPDVTIAINWYSESKMPHPTAQSESEPIAEWWGQGKDPTARLQKACPSNHLASDRAWNSLLPPLDYCHESQGDLAKYHGFFQGPGSFGPVNKLIPMLSRAKLSNFADVLAPNVCYGSPVYRGAPDTVPWEDKEDNLYWRGAFTGLLPTPDNWAGGHRHRMGRYFKQLREAHNKLTTGVEVDPFDLKYGANRSIVPTRESTNVGGNTLPPFDYSDVELVKVLKRLGPDAFNVAFHRYDPANAEMQAIYKKYFPITGQEPRATVNLHRYLLDTDGESMSCRFYHLLHTKAVVFKQTIWSEWHDDRLVPWIHYVPLDLRVESNQLPHYLDFFQNHPQGPETAQKIAAVSTEWALTTLRRIDVSLYFARLMIEYSDQVFNVKG